MEERHAVRADLAQRIPPRFSTGPRHSSLRQRSQRDQVSRQRHQLHPHRRSDTASPVLGRRQRQLHPAGTLEPDRLHRGHHRGQQPVGQRAPVRTAQRGARRCRHRLLGCQVHLRWMASGDRHQPGRHRWQRCHHSRHHLARTADQPESPGLCVGTLDLQRRRCHGAGRRLRRQHRVCHQQQHLAGGDAQLHQFQPGGR